MNFAKTTICLALVLAVPAAFTGCGKTKTGDTKKTGKSGDGGGGHPEKGPNGGAILEVGKDHTFHAEFLFDKKNETVTIHILDETGNTVKPIDAKEVVISLNHEGEQETYKLPAKPADGETGGKSSRFQLKDGDLIHALTHDDAEPKLLFTVAGNTRSGEIKVPKEK